MKKKLFRYTDVTSGLVGILDTNKLLAVTPQGSVTPMVGTEPAVTVYLTYVSTATNCCLSQGDLNRLVSVMENDNKKEKIKAILKDEDYEKIENVLDN